MLVLQLNENNLGDKMEQDNIFAKRLKESRLRTGLKQADLAEKAGITAASISAYESADGTKGKNPSLENAKAIAKALGVSLDWLCGLSDSNSDVSSGSIEDNRLSSAVRFITSLIECGAFKVKRVSTTITEIDREGYPEEVEVERAQLIATNHWLSNAIINIAALFDVYGDGILPKEAYAMSKNAIVENVSDYVVHAEPWSDAQCFPPDRVNNPGIYRCSGGRAMNDNELFEEIPF